MIDEVHVCLLSASDVMGNMKYRLCSVCFPSVHMYTTTRATGGVFGFLISKTLSFRIYPCLSLRLISFLFRVAGNEYNNTVSLRQPASSGQPFSSPTEIRQTHNFYPTYPLQSRVIGQSLPPVHDGMDSIPSHASLITPANSASVKDEDEDKKAALFGDLPEAKRRKFILVDDNQRGTRVRVRVALDQVKMEDMPDSHLKANSVYPRSYYPRQMRSPPGSPGDPGNWDDDESEDEESSAGTLPSSKGKTFVRVPLMDGSHAQLPVPRMTRGRRAKECALNELGYRMSWSQAKTFNGRTIFMQRSRMSWPKPFCYYHATTDIAVVDAYRNKMRSTMLANGQDVSTIASHFEARRGKRKWLEHGKRSRREASPQGSLTM